jgi:5-methyltetrahydrofolate--homocysteine methyltransferase
MNEDMRVSYNGTPAVMAAYARLARNAGARIIGGCCGTTAAHVAAMVGELRNSRKDGPPGYEEIEAELGPIRKRTTQWTKPPLSAEQRP